MTTLRIGTPVVSGAHTALWLPRSFEYRRQMESLQPEGGTYVRRFRRFHRNLHLLEVSSLLRLLYDLLLPLATRIFVAPLECSCYGC
ncbi:MAG: hypothetical protein ABSH56_16785 [Bryobacteraceae bacterium]|jgi:hypothetical protein